MKDKAARIGVLALQGDVREHVRQLKTVGAEVELVRYPEELEGLAGLVLPGGESTTVGKLLVRHQLMEPLRERLQAGLAVLGTCTGLILLASDIKGSDQPRLGVMNMQVARNAFGRQVASFEADLVIPALGPEPFRAVFIRGPVITSVGPEVEVLARIPEGIVLARQGRCLACAFHPELTKDLRLHEYFLQLAQSTVEPAVELGK